MPDREDCRSERGATMVETALTAAVMFAALIGVIQLCLALFTYNTIDEAAREASRWAMVRGGSSCANTSSSLPGCGATPAQIQTYVQGLGYPGLSSTTVTTQWCTASSSTPTTWSGCGSGTSNAPGNQVMVTVHYTFPLYIPFWKDANVTMGASSSAIVQQ